MVVALRENSRMRGLTSQDSATNTSGSCSAISSRSRRSCTGLRKDHSSDTAIARIPSSSSDRIAARASSSSSATTMVPSRSIALGDLQGVPLGQQAVVLGLPEDVLQLVRRAPEVAALDVHDEDRVAVALGGEEPDRRHVAHHQRVQRRRGAVGDVVGAGEHVRQGDAQLLGQQLEHVEDPAGIVRRGGRGLRGEHGPGVVVQDGIGERAAHVHADDIGHWLGSFTDRGRSVRPGTRP